MKKAVILILSLLLCGCTARSDKPQSTEQSRLQSSILKLNSSSAVPRLQLEDIKNNVGDTDVYEPVNYDIQKGIWLSYIDLEPMLTGKTEEAFEASFRTACENISSVGCNTVYVQVRPFGDALYSSELYPASKYITGNVGQAGAFDPLKIMCDIAHEYKLSLHGWINPLRCENEENFSCIDSRYKIKQWYENSDSEDKIKQVEGDTHLWLDPAYEEVRKLIADGAREIAENYDVDGIHYDDYFYPTTDKDFDSSCYKEKSGGRSLEEWRRENISEMVREIYSAVKSVDESIQVGISPQGNIENNYNNMYADVSLWGSEEGYADYIEPQIYFGYENPVKPFLQTVKDWQGIVTNDKIRLVIGLGAYKIFNEEEFSENEGIIADQISDSLTACGGVGLYAYNSIFTPEDDYSERMQTEKEQIGKVLCEK